MSTKFANVDGFSSNLDFLDPLANRHFNERSAFWICRPRLAKNALDLRTLIRQRDVNTHFFLLFVHSGNWAPVTSHHRMVAPIMNESAIRAVEGVQCVIYWIGVWCEIRSGRNGSFVTSDQPCDAADTMSYFEAIHTRQIYQDRAHSGLRPSFASLMAPSNFCEMSRQITHNCDRVKDRAENICMFEFSLLT